MLEERELSRPFAQTITQELWMVIRHILRYLIAHPDAKDTMQGMLQWWFPEDRREWREEEIQEALDRSVARGWVTERQTTPSQTLYGLNKDKQAEVEAFLHELESGAK